MTIFVLLWHKDMSMIYMGQWQSISSLNTQIIQKPIVITESTINLFSIKFHSRFEKVVNILLTAIRTVAPTDIQLYWSFKLNTARIITMEWVVRV